MEKHLTTGSVLKNIVLFSLPYLLSYFLQTLYGMADLFIIGQYLRGYVWDCIFAGIHFSSSGYFCACGKSYLSFLHNITAIVLVRVPGAYLMSKMFPQTLFPMGLATAAGSLLSAIICVIAFFIIKLKRPD